MSATTTKTAVQGFAIPANMPKDKAQELLKKAVHLSEGQREQVWRDYLEAIGESDTSDADDDAARAGGEYAKNDTPWSKIGGGVNTTEVLAKVASGEIAPGDAARMLASTDGLRIRHNPTGTVSVKGGGKYPWASLYADQWQKLIAVGNEVLGYIQSNYAEIEANEQANKDAKAAKAKSGK